MKEEGYQPWLPASAIEWLDGFLEEGAYVLEYGSGGSTLFVAKRIGLSGRLDSVEHDAKWYGNIRCELQERFSERNIHYHFVPLLEHEYLRPIKEAPIHGADLIIVDGRYRNAVFKEATSKVAPGGYILFDNFLREKYTESWRLVRRLGWTVELCLWTDDDNGKAPRYHWHCALIRVPKDEDTEEEAKTEDPSHD